MIQRDSSAVFLLLSFSVVATLPWHHHQVPFPLLKDCIRNSRVTAQHQSQITDEFHSFHNASVSSLVVQCVECGSSICVLY